MRVLIKQTGDEQIDRYAGHIGTVVKIEASELAEKRNDPNYAHYSVQMPDGSIVVINRGEFEIVESE